MNVKIRDERHARAQRLRKHAIFSDFTCSDKHSECDPIWSSSLESQNVLPADEAASHTKRLVLLGFLDAPICKALVLCVSSVIVLLNGGHWNLLDRRGEEVVVVVVWWWWWKKRAKRRRSRIISRCEDRTSGRLRSDLYTRSRRCPQYLTFRGLRGWGTSIHAGGACASRLPACS